METIRTMSNLAVGSQIETPVGSPPGSALKQERSEGVLERGKNRSEGDGTTVLLTEDDATVRKLVRAILENLGYKVLEAENGQQALDVSLAYTNPIHLLITDVVMPRMGGIELIDHLSTTRKDTKIILMSGYTGDSRVQDCISSTRRTFLAKPFTPAALTSLVRDVLAGAVPDS